MDCIKCKQKVDESKEYLQMEEYFRSSIRKHGAPPRPIENTDKITIICIECVKKSRQPENKDKILTQP